MVGDNDEVVDHWPPQYIINQPVEEMSTEVFVEENDLVTVRMFKVSAEWMYSNPTGLYNLSLPEKKLRSHLNFRAPERHYGEWKKSQSTGVAAEFRKEEEGEGDDPNQDAEADVNEFEGLDVRHWDDHSSFGEVLLRIDVENTSRELVKVEIGIEAEEGSHPNCHLPLTSFYTQIYSKNVSTRPVVALIQKIDPSKPFG